MNINKLCGVCGDKALGYNFNALTCESCKAFFRRNALRNKTFRCITAGKCVLNPKTRKYCRKCRLEKCLAIGMKKEWILTEEEKTLKRRKHRNRDFERSACDSTGNESRSESHGRTSNNIIILMGKECDDHLSNLDKDEIINFINTKFNLQLDSGQFHMRIDGSKDSQAKVVEVKSESDESDSDSNHGVGKPHTPPAASNQILVCKLETLSELSGNSDHNKSGNSATENFFTENTYSEQQAEMPQDYNENAQLSASDLYFAPEVENFTETKQLDFCANPTAGQLTMFSSTSGENAFESNYNPSMYETSMAMETEGRVRRKSTLDSIGWLPNGLERATDPISNEIYYHAMRLEYTTNPIKDETGTRSLQRLNQLEEKRLEEVNHHLKGLYKKDLPPMPNGQAHKKVVVDNLAFSMELYEVVIKKIIMSIKNIQSFRAMCQDDQIILLKSSASGIKTLLNIRYFDQTQNCCLQPNPLVSEHKMKVEQFWSPCLKLCRLGHKLRQTALLCAAKSNFETSQDPQSILVIDHNYIKRAYGEDLYNKCQSFMLSFRDDWKFDGSIINLMAMILLFYPDRPNLTHREYIKLEYLTYCHLLQRYLEVKYNSVCEAKTVYINLMARLYEISEFNELCTELMLKLDHKYIGPLTSELYDLKTRHLSGDKTLTQGGAHDLL